MAGMKITRSYGKRSRGMPSGTHDAGAAWQRALGRSWVRGKLARGNFSGRSSRPSRRGKSVVPIH